MKRSIILSVLALIAIMLQAGAQTPEKPIATVHYNLAQIIDSTQRDVVKIMDMVLFLGKESSLCTNYADMKTEERMKIYWSKKHEEVHTGLTLSYGLPYTFRKDMVNHKLTSRALFRGNNYVIEEKTAEAYFKDRLGKSGTSSGSTPGTKGGGNADGAPAMTKAYNNPIEKDPK